MNEHKNRAIQAAEKFVTAKGDDLLAVEAALSVQCFRDSMRFDAEASRSSFMPRPTWFALSPVSFICSAEDQSAHGGIGDAEIIRRLLEGDDSSVVFCALVE